MKKFFDESNIPNDQLNILNDIYEKLNKQCVDGAFFGGYPFVDVSNDNTCCMRGIIISKKGLFVFYKTEAEKELYWRYIIKIMMDAVNVSRIILGPPEILFFIELNATIDEIIDTITEKSEIIKDEIVREAISAVQNILNLVTKDKRKLTKQNSLGAKIVRRSKIEANFDEQQFGLIYQKNDNHMRVRGLAGSGKTILLVKKMAYMHFKDPDKDIAYIFYTKSLKQTIDNFFLKFYKEFDTSYASKPNMEKIHIMHGWGASKNPGLYSTICSKLEYPVEQYSTGNDLNKVCTSLLEKIIKDKREDEIHIYDYILIDEAQDFSLSFFKLALASLKKFGKLIYAYDELQTLNDYRVKMPEPKEIFGDVTYCEDKNLSECYRSPKEIIVTAHALGLGIYHKNTAGQIEFCNVIEDENIWCATGYKIVEGNLDYGQHVALERDQIIKNEIEDIIIAEKVSKDEQNKKTIAEIVRLIKDEDVSPEDILIIDLDSIALNNNYESFLNDTIEYLKDNNCIDGNGKRLFELNLVNRESSYSFKIDGSISYTTVFRAKGNESNIVFILNTDKMSSQASFNRNKIFTAMTRAKFKVYLYGTGLGMDSIIDEIADVKKNKYRLSFTYPTKDDMQKYKDRFYRETQRVVRFESLFAGKDDIYMKDKKELIKMMIEQFGVEEVSRILQNYENDEK